MVPQPDISQTAAGLRLADSVEGRKRITESRVRTVSIETVAHRAQVSEEAKFVDVSVGVMDHKLG